MVIKSCYIYTRVSTAAQVEGYSLDAQLEALREYAEYRDLKIAGEYCDAGKSGKSIKGRPAFRQMMDDVVAQKDGIAFVLVFKLSRFGRNAADIMRSLQTLTDFGIDLVSVNESIDSSTQGGRLTLAILSAVAEMERENISVQFMSGKMQKAMNGGWTGGTIPYGYRSIDRRLVPDAYEAEVIRKIFELYGQDGSTASSVSDAMNKSAYVRRDMQHGGEKPFTYDFVARILDNPFYCGRIYYGRKTNKKDHNGKPIKLDPAAVIEATGCHEPIVSEEVWDEIHEKRTMVAEKYKKSAESVYVHVLSGLVRCPVCGKPLSGSVSRTKKLAGDGYYRSIQYYSCRYNVRQNGRTCSFGKRLNQEIVDGLVLQVIANLQLYEGFSEAIRKASGDKGTIESAEEKLRRLRTELRDAEFSKNKLGEKLDGLNPLRPDYDKRYRQVSEKLDEAYDRIDELEAAIEETRDLLGVLKGKSDIGTRVMDFLENAKLLLEKMTPQEKKELCGSFIDRIDLFPEDRTDGKVIRSISFRFPLAFDGREMTAAKDPDSVFLFTLDCSGIDIDLPEKGNIEMKNLPDGSRKAIVRKGTYKAIKEYVAEHYGTKVSTLFIAQVKRKYGLDMGKAYNKPEEPKARVPRCTPEKEKKILEALKHFDLLGQDVEYQEGE